MDKGRPLTRHGALAGRGATANELEEQKKYTEAISMLDRAIERNPENVKALLDKKDIIMSGIQNPGN
jgi:hypothetical protein